MAGREFKRQAWKTPIELRLHRAGLIGFGLLAIALMLLNRAEDSFVTKARVALADVASGAMAGLAAAGGWATKAVDSAVNVVSLYDENERLRRENADLLAWRARALESERRIEQFEAVLDIAYTPVDEIVAASVIADASGPFARALIVNAGASQGVREGDAALDRFGLVGRVVATGYASARVLLLADPASRVPVLIEPGRIEAIVAGDLSGPPRLEFLPGAARLSGGETLTTSGVGGLFPPGLPVGAVELGEDGGARVRLYADAARVEVVALKRFEIRNDVQDPARLMSDRDDDAERAALTTRGLDAAARPRN